MRVCIAFEYGYLLKQQLSMCEGENITFEFQPPDIHITWNFKQRIYLSVYYQVKGLCGMYDRFLLNDFTTENGIMESVDQYFADNFLSDPLTHLHVTATHLVFRAHHVMRMLG